MIPPNSPLVAAERQGRQAIFVKQPPFSPMYSAKPGFPRPSRQKQIPSSQFNKDS